jgi:chromosome segregation protein
VHLRSITLVGFKSFADRTRLLFEPGVTVVVGPNGSGKSNVVDAIAWVMGTQATSALRTQRMEDVIFAGTTLRPALGRAEVSLTVDNGDGDLPVDLAEVTITRRLYRDGTSEYEINGAHCRLLDIQDLLSDSGVGRHQHILVGQGRVDAVLSAGPDEHRAVIEEAAGVIKHRQRRDRALRRLEATDGDVQRLRDLLGEQQRRMRPLHRQARAAERFEAAQREWRALRLWVGGDRLRQILRRTADVAAGQAETRARIADDESAVAGLESEVIRLRADHGAIGRALERDTAAAARLETAVERFRRVSMVARERRAAVESRLAGAGERRRELEAEAGQLAAALDEAVADATAARADLERLAVSVAALEDEERSLADHDRLPAEGVVAAARGDVAALEAADRRDAAEREAAVSRARVIADKIADDLREEQRLENEIRAADAALGPAQAAHDEASRLARDADEAAAAAAEAHAEARLAEAAALARLEAFEAAVHGIVDPEARAAVERLDGVLGPVVARLDVPDSHAAAVDAALGSWSGAFAAAAIDGVFAAAGAVKAEGSGGVAFVVSAPSPQVPARSVAAETGTDALVDLLGPGADRELAATLLGDVVLVEGWAGGWDLVRRHPEVRAITPEGDVIIATGIRTADPDGAGPAALEVAEVALERARVATARAASRLTTARREAQQRRAEADSARQAVEAAEAGVGGATEALRLVARARSEAEAERARLAQRRGALDEAAATRADRLAELRSRLAAFEGEEAARQAAWEELARRRDHVAERRVRARRHHEEAARSAAGAEERVRMLQRRSADVSDLLSGIDERPVDPAEAERLSTLESAARRAAAAALRHMENLRERQRSLRTSADAGKARFEEAEARRVELHERLAGDREALSSLDVEAAELRVRHEAVAEGLRRDLDTEEEPALEADRPDLPEGVDAEEHLRTLEATLRRLGPVNPLAASEYRELAERAEFLEEQLSDLEQSRRELQRVVAALDEEIGRRFATAFADIARHYRENFALLFPGGSGNLALTDPDDPLSSGVEITAQPMGKKVSRLALLSGGERSLAALAFQFAVFRARPSPFYVLDEVEAALDDANLRRFLRLVEMLRSTSQLVIVTHQQQTMEAADVLYGVTMEPGESSRVLARRMSDAPSGEPVR